MVEQIIKFNAKYRNSTNARLGTNLFVKVPRPGYSEVTFSVFESSCHLLLRFYMLNVKQGSCEY